MKNPSLEGRDFLSATVLDQEDAEQIAASVLKRS